MPWRRGVRALLLLLSLGWSLRGQGHATLSGQVHDSSGGVIPRATLILWNQETGQSRAVETNDIGTYVFPHLQPGSYGISVTSPGLRKLTRSGIRLYVSDRVTLDIVLRVAGVENAVTVTAADEPTRSGTGSLIAAVDPKRIEYLPLNRRDVTQLITTQAGVVTGTESATEGSGYAVNGSRQHGVHYTLDGGANTDSYRHFSGVFPNASAIEEVSVERSNLSAEYGNSGGAVVSVITKSGTNELHGSAYGFVRNGIFNARDFFAAKRDNLKRSQFGGTLGGPVWRNRLFFFGSYQGTRLRTEPVLTRQYLPTAAMRAGDFSILQQAITDPLTGVPFPGNRIPPARLSAVTHALLQYIPVPYSAVGDRMIGVQDSTAEDEYTARADYQTVAHRLTGRYFYRSLEKPFAGNPLDLASMYGPAVGATNQPYSHATVSDTWIVSQQTINVVTFAIRTRRTQNNWNAVELPINFAGAGVRGIAVKSPASMYINVTGHFLARPGWNYDKRDGDIHIANTLTTMRGRHELRIGAENLFVRNNIQNEFRTMGNFDFNGSASGNALSDFLLGEVYQFWQGGGEYKDLTGYRFGVFLQDDWRARPNLTLNLGIRWEPVVPYSDRRGRTQCFVPGEQSLRFARAPVGYLVAGDPSCPDGGYRSYWRSVAPRFGFAWRPFGGSTVVRGGAGIFWHPQFTMLYNGFVNSAPFSPQVTRNGVRFEDPYANAQNPFPQGFAPFEPPADALFPQPLGQFGAFSSTYRPAYSDSLNLTLERPIVGRWTGRLSYIGSLGRQLSYTQDVNFARYTADATLGNLQRRRPYSSFAGLLLAESGSTSSYHALEAAATRRGPAGMTLDLSYTWSKAIDDNSEESRPGQTASIAIPYDRRSGRAVSDFDVRHRFVASGVWPVPVSAGRGGWLHRFGADWTIAGIAILRTGLPFSVRSGADRSLSGVGQDYADLIGDPHLSADRSRNAQISQYFDTAAFTMAERGTFGNSPRNVLRAPGSVNVDIAAVKGIPVQDRVSAELRAEFFNALNNVNLGAPFAVVNTPSRFGRIESSAPARTVQVAVKLIF